MVFNQKYTITLKIHRGLVEVERVRGFPDAINLKNDRDMTNWLAYFVDGLRSQMTEIQTTGKQLIKQDSRLQKIKIKGLNERQEKAVKYLIRKGTLSV